MLTDSDQRQTVAYYFCLAAAGALCLLAIFGALLLVWLAAVNPGDVGPFERAAYLMISGGLLVLADPRRLDVG